SATLMFEHVVAPVALPYGRAFDTLDPDSRFCSRQRSFENSWISSATAEISLARFANFVERRVRVLFEIGRDRRHEPWRAETAHQTIMFDESTLHRAQVLGRAEAFDGRQLFSDRVNRQH